MSDAIRAAETALQVVQAQATDVRRQINAAMAKAREDITAEFADAVRDASRAVNAAQGALRVALEADTPAHEWDARRVYRMHETRRNHWEPSQLVRLDGIVETRRPSTQFPGNVGVYSYPPMGEGFVRLLKKDGTPGLAFERFGAAAWAAARGWKLAE